MQCALQSLRGPSSTAIMRRAVPMQRFSSCCRRHPLTDEMPTYDYRCRSCGHTIEVIHSMLDKGPSSCELCGGELKRVFYPTGIIFKGSGFYKTDSRRADRRPSDADGSSSGSPPSSGDGSSATAGSGSSTGGSGSGSGASHDGSGSGGSSSKEGGSGASPAGGGGTSPSAPPRKTSSGSEGD